MLNEELILEMYNYAIDSVSVKGMYIMRSQTHKAWISMRA